MAFRLSSFLGGLSKGTLEIEKEHKERVFDVIDKSLEFNAENALEADRARKELERERRILAKNLSSLEGMDDEKIAVVLDHGPDTAKAFLEKAPVIASKNQIDVGSLVDLTAPAGEGFDLNTMIERDGFSVVDMSPTLMKPELSRSPVFGADFSEYAADRQKEVYSSFGISDEEFEPYGGPRPEGRIRFQDMLEKESPEVPYYGASTVDDKLLEQIADGLGVYATYKTGPDGRERLVLDPENKELEAKARTMARDAKLFYNKSLRDGDYDVKYDQDLAMQAAVQEAFKGYEISAGDTSITSDAPETTEPPPPASLDQQIAITKSPAVLAQLIKQRAEAQGQTMSNAEANKEAKKILDERRADAQ